VSRIVNHSNTLAASSTLKLITKLIKISFYLHFITCYKHWNLCRFTPKNKSLLYHCHILSKLSWNLTVANLSKTWICEHLDNVVANCIRLWLELPISAKLGAIILSHNNFGLSFQLPICLIYTMPNCLIFCSEFFRG